ncbi:MAG: hypothetical protein RQ736_06205 [Thiogranum sp.]|nr:hypothetical protein [Thiogranum sp.]
MIVQRDENGVAARPLTVRVDDVAYWLEQWQRVLALPEDNLQLALQVREDEFARTDNARNRLRLALLLATGPAPVRDQKRASSLLKEIDISTAGGGEKAFAALLEQMIAEQQWSSDKMTELKARLSATEARVAELEQQLQELKNIEQTIQQRN